MPHFKGWELRFRVEQDPKLKSPELIWHGGLQLQRAFHGLTPEFVRALKSVTVRAPATMVDGRLKERLGKKAVMGKALSRNELNTDPLKR
jgi:hypothetical protein